jgi:hypothetical protein
MKRLRQPLGHPFDTSALIIPFAPRRERMHASGDLLRPTSIVL